MSMSNVIVNVNVNVDVNVDVDVDVNVFILGDVVSEFLFCIPSFNMGSGSWEVTLSLVRITTRAKTHLLPLILH